MVPLPDRWLVPDGYRFHRGNIGLFRKAMMEERMNEYTTVTYKIEDDRGSLRTLEPGEVGKVVRAQYLDGKPHIVIQFGEELWVIELIACDLLLTPEEFALEMVRAGKCTTPPHPGTVARWMKEHGLRYHFVTSETGRPPRRIPFSEVERFNPPQKGRRKNDGQENNI